VDSVAYVQFDPEIAPPADENRPAVESGAHKGPRTWLETHEQILNFLETTQVTDPCDGPCTGSNTSPALSED